LPKVDGHEVLKRIKGDPRTCGIPVVVLTSSSEERDVMRTYDVGANSYIVKPVDFEQFTESVRDIGKYWLMITIRTAASSGRETLGSSPSGCVVACAPFRSFFEASRPRNAFSLSGLDTRGHDHRIARQHFLIVAAVPRRDPTVRSAARKCRRDDAHAAD